MGHELMRERSVPIIKVWGIRENSLSVSPQKTGRNSVSPEVKYIQPTTNTVTL